MESSHRRLCNDLLRDILGRLPTNSLLRFKTVSKSWSSLISDPCFRHNSPKIIISESRSDWFSSDLDSPQNLEKLDLPAEFDQVTKSSTLDPVGSCNGLFLLKDLDHQNHLWMLNPSSRECYCINIPKFNSPDSKYLKYQNYGFGYSSVDDDYKIIRIFSYEENHVFNHVTYVYSLRNNTWRKPQKGLDLCCNLKGTSMFVNGKLHYIAYPRNKNQPYILGFDVSNEEYFKVAELPKVEDKNTGFGYLKELGGCLSVTEIELKSYCVAAVWVLKESGWVEVFRTNVCFDFMVPLAYSKNGDEVLMYDFFSCVWYNVVTGGVEKVWPKKCGVRVTVCLDTLVSISAYRGVEEKNKGECSSSIKSD